MPQRGPGFWRALAAQEARRAGINPAIFLRQINQESGFNPNARSGAGAVGIAQIVPRYHPNVNPNDPYASLKYAANYMADLIHQYGGSYEKALSVYNSGGPNRYRDPNFSGGQTYNYVRSIMGGQTPSAAVPQNNPLGTAAVPALNQPTRTLQEDSKERGLALLHGLMKDASIPSLIQDIRSSPNRPQSSSLGTPALPAGFNNLTKLPSGSHVVASGTFKPGVPVAGLTSIGGEHETMGLAGYPAKDYFAPPGSGVVAPVTGKVIKLSGHDPAGGPSQGPHGPLGWSVYIQGVDGHIYYMTHMGSRQVKLGQTVKAGTPIGTVANYDRYGTPSHIHMGVH